MSYSESTEYKNRFIVGHVVFSEREDHFRVEQVSPCKIRGGFNGGKERIVKSCDVLHRTCKLSNGKPDTSRVISNQEWAA